MRARTAPVLAALAVVLAGCGGPVDGTGHDDADVAFASAMVPHHRAAVVMARTALDRAVSPEVKALARQIDAEQVPEVVALQDLLGRWGAAAGTDAMPMGELDAATGPAFDRLFLETMIKHHGAGVAMARTELADGQNDDAKQLAQNISDAQQAQTTWMLQLLASR